MALLVQEVQGGLINKINENSSSLNSLTWATESVETVVWSNNNTAWIIFTVFNGKRHAQEFVVQNMFTSSTLPV